LKKANGNQVFIIYIISAACHATSCPFLAAPARIPFSTPCNLGLGIANIWEEHRLPMTDLFPMIDLNVLAQGDRTIRSWPLRKSPAAILRGWFGLLIGRHAPVGYQDETGFHYGIQPVPNEFRRPLRVQD
jgi:hypothetical protein